MSCPICEGPVPDAAHEGQFLGAMSRWDNKTEVCSLCGHAEAMGPVLNAVSRSLMVAARDYQEAGNMKTGWQLWVEGVLKQHPASRRSLEAAAAAAAKE